MTEIQFWLTALKPFELDVNTQYPVLAIRVTHSPVGNTRIGTRHTSRENGSLFESKQIYAKDSYFLTADQSGSFKWVAPHESSLYKPEITMNYLPEDRKRLTRYSVEEDVREDMNMIYPVRPFSITKVELEGFDPGKEYPVLAIDIDKYLPGEDEVEKPEEPQSETMAFFLVGDDNGEFAWVAEEECRLYSLQAEPQ